MEINTDRIDQYIKGFTEAELCDYIKKQAMSLNGLAKKRTKASKREGEAHTHTSRAMRTTLYANTEKLSYVYNQQVEALKYIVNKLI